ncbi:LLM class flavin-dependent oxidoreductase [Bacillus toyonensis]|uniref:LLM class flavin-dependent oxidoreductase n=1 Tax=Bacillus toyonensis TaxID=155322 RepID=UPI0018D0F1A1|nr:LLM class flavin-dependent oxidoreductase [Bacillus toyonensis]
MAHNISFSWFCPSHGPGANGHNTIYNLNDILKVVKQAEQIGIESILTPADSNCYDPWILAAFIVQNTTRIKPIVALRTGFIEPVYATRMLSTFYELSSGRIEINIVSGGSKIELLKEGNLLAHEDRYKRTNEFVQIMHSLLKSTNQSYIFSGKFYEVKNATLYPSIEQEPKIYIAGSSRSSKEIASNFNDTYLLWAEPRSNVKEHIDELHKIKGDIPVCLRINILIRDSDELAQKTAQSYGSKLTSQMARLITKHSDSVGQKRMSELAKDIKCYDECLWTGLSIGKTGSVPTLIGSKKTVKEAIQKYINIGVNGFIFSSFTPEEDLLHLKEIIRDLKIINKN